MAKMGNSAGPGLGGDHVQSMVIDLRGIEIRRVSIGPYAFKFSEFRHVEHRWQSIRVL